MKRVARRTGHEIEATAAAAGKANASDKVITQQVA